MQPVQTLIICRVSAASDLGLHGLVCKCPFYVTPGINAFSSKKRLSSTNLSKRYINAFSLGPVVQS